MIIEFVIPGRPVPMGRPRNGRRGPWTPARSKVAMEAFALQAAQYKPPEPIAVACSVSIDFLFEIGKSDSRRVLLEDGFQLADVGSCNGDVDNLAKLVLDALDHSGWFLASDQQVWELVARKRLALCSETRVQIVWSSR